MEHWKKRKRLVTTSKTIATNWMLTVPADKWKPPQELYDGLKYMCGQLEQGEGGYIHWQLFVSHRKQCRFGFLKKLFACDETHCEACKDKGLSQAYCMKDDPTYRGGRFELGLYDGRRFNWRAKKTLGTISAGVTAEAKKEEPTLPPHIVEMNMHLEQLSMTRKALTALRADDPFFDRVPWAKPSFNYREWINVDDE